MLEEITKTTNYLENNLISEDIEFNNILEKNIDEILLKIQEQEDQKNTLSTFINSISDNSEKNNYIADCNKILELINTNIKSLSSIGMLLNNLKEKSLTNHLENIQANIKEYTDEITKYSDILKNNTIEINTFFENNNISSSEEYNSTNSNTSSKNEKNHIDNLVLIISEKDNKVYLPYKEKEINLYLEQFPKKYSNFEDVINKEFIVPLNNYTKSPILSRFRETYSLIRDREAKSVIEALKYSFSLMFHYKLNPAIIAACKTQEQLDDYLWCLECDNLENFKHFKIQFNINPLKINL